ncbi:MAG: DUF5412 family protein [Nitrososphaerales archaeon]
MKDLVFISMLLLASISQVGCTFSIPCDDEIKHEKGSPDGKYVATFYERDCGATTDFSTIVNIRPRAEKFNGKKGSLFIVKGRHQINIAWKDRGKLQIECKDCRSEDVFKQERVWSDIEISYVVP